MKKIIFALFLFLFLSDNVKAETIETPYLYYRSSQNSKLEIGEIREEETTYLLEEKAPSKTKEYYPLGKNPKDYPFRTNEVNYSEWSEWGTKKETTMEEEQQTLYTYQRLKKIDSLVIETSPSLALLSIKINGKEYLEKNSSLIYLESPLEIKLEKSFYPEEITLEIKVYRLLNDSKAKLTMTDKRQEYIEKEIKVTTPGISQITEKGIHLLKKLLLERETKTTNDLKDLFYIHILNEKVEYRYREKKYKYQKKPKQILSQEKEKEGYYVKEETTTYHFYRKEKIELYDNIILDGYIELNNIVKTTTFPLKNLKIASSMPCGNTILTFTYQTFSFQKEAYIKCEEERK